MKSTLYLKFILLYIILGFLSIFTVASLSSTLTTHYLESSISGNMYQSANLLASNYLPDYFSKTITLADVYTQLNGMSDYLNSDIWFVDNEGIFACICQIRRCIVCPFPDLKILILPNPVAPLI